MVIGKGLPIFSGVLQHVALKPMVLTSFASGAVAKIYRPALGAC